MASNIRPLRRKLRLTKGRLVGRMSQERQRLSGFFSLVFFLLNNNVFIFRLSFLLVIMFLAIFGVIVLAEVLFMEDGKNEILYDDAPLSSDLLGGGWETPKPLVAMTSPPTPPDRKVKREKLKESLKR